MTQIQTQSPIELQEADFLDGLNIPVDDGTFDQNMVEHSSHLDSSSKWLMRVIILFELIFALFTFPHNVHAFGLETYWSLEALGVATLEAAMLIATYHYTHGLIISHAKATAEGTRLSLRQIFNGSQSSWVGLSFWGTLTLMASNSIISQLLKMIEKGTPVAPSLEGFVLGYQAFVLPTTIIVSFAFIIQLIASHPKVQQMANNNRYTVDNARQQQTANIQKSQALQAVALELIAADEAKATAHAKRVQSQSAATIKRLQLRDDLQAKRDRLTYETQAAEVDKQLATVESKTNKATQATLLAKATHEAVSAAVQIKVEELIESEEFEEVVQEKARQIIVEQMGIAANSKLAKSITAGK